MCAEETTLIANDRNTRERIIRAATTIFAQKGYAGATTRSIAALADVNEVTLFRHFGSKENLLEAVIEQHTELPTLADQLQSRLTGKYRGDLGEIAHLFFRIIRERREVLRLMLCEAEQFPELRETLAKTPIRLRELLVTCLQQFQADGQLLQDLPLESMAQAFWGMLFSYAISQGLFGEATPPDRQTDRVIDHFVDLFVAGTIRPDLENKLMEGAVTVESITRCFQSLVAVDDLSFTVARGEIFGLLGPNGAGKTTTINLITGMLKPSAGRALVLGKDPISNGRWVRQRIGLVPQETNLYLDLNAVDNMWHHAALYLSDLSGAGESIRALLTLMNLWDRRQDTVRTFSGGMKRRLALARTLLHDPEVILFDEPTLGVDVQGKHAIWDHVRALRDLGKTFVISTNDMSEADALCDRLVIIDHGRDIALGTPERLKAQLGRDVITLRTTPPIADPATLFAGLGVRCSSGPSAQGVRLEVADADRILGQVVARAAAQHTIESVLMARPSLDDVFLYHTGRALRE